MSRFHTGTKQRYKKNSNMTLSEEVILYSDSTYRSQNINICYKESIVSQGTQPTPAFLFGFLLSLCAQPGANWSPCAVCTQHPAVEWMIWGNGDLHHETNQCKPVRFWCSVSRSVRLVPRADIPSLVLHPWHGLVCKYKRCCELGDGSRRLWAPSFHEIKCFSVSQLHAGLNFHGG